MLAMGRLSSIVPAQMSFLPPEPPSSVPPPTLGEPSGPSSPPPGVPPAASATSAPGWKPWVGFVAVVVGFGGAGVLGAIWLIATVGIDDGEIGDPSAVGGIGALVLQNLSIIAATVGLAAIFSRPRAWHFGWRPVQRVWQALGWSALLYVSFVLVSAVWLFAIGQTDEEQTLAKDLGADESTLAAIIIALLVAYGAPVVEELLFRGFMFGSLRGRLSVIPAAIITGIVFGLAHVAGSPIAFILPLALFGFGLCLLYHQTGSLYPSMAVHAVNNSVAITSALKWDWYWAPVLIATSLTMLALTALVVSRLSGPVPADAPCP